MPAMAHGAGRAYSAIDGQPAGRCGDRLCAWRRQSAVAEAVRRCDLDLQTVEDLGNDASMSGADRVRVVAGRKNVIRELLMRRVAEAFERGDLNPLFCAID